MSEGSAGDANSNPSSAHALREWIESALADKKVGLSEQEWQILHSAASHSSGQLVDFAVAIVDSLLGLRFPTLQQDETLRRKMTERIAQTLCSDPTSRQRLIEFQQNLVNRHT